MLKKISLKLDPFPKQKEKLFLLCYSTLGVDVERVNEIKFDYELAESLWYYKSEYSKIETTNIPRNFQC